MFMTTKMASRGMKPQLKVNQDEGKETEVCRGLQGLRIKSEDEDVCNEEHEPAAAGTDIDVEGEPSKIETKFDKENENNCKDVGPSKPKLDGPGSTRDAEKGQPSYDAFLGSCIGGAKPKSKDEKGPDEAKQLRDALQRRLCEPPADDCEDSEKIIKSFDPEDIVCALFTLKLPPFNKKIGSKMARKCAEFLFKNRNPTGKKFGLATNKKRKWLKQRD